VFEEKEGSGGSVFLRSQAEQKYKKKRVDPLETNALEGERERIDCGFNSSNTSEGKIGEKKKEKEFIRGPGRRGDYSQGETRLVL